MKMTRLYATEDGESHFADTELEFSLTEHVEGAPAVGLSESLGSTEFRFMKAPTGWASDWHPTSARNFFVVLSGEWEVTASDGETRGFSAGSLLLVEDTSGAGHTSRVVSEVESIALMVQLS